MAEIHVSLASHAIGLDYKKPYTRHGKKFYKPYRNYYTVHLGGYAFRLWDEMEKEGKAKSKKSKTGAMFWLTRLGLDWLGEQLGIHIYDEED